MHKRKFILNRNLYKKIRLSKCTCGDDTQADNTKRKVSSSSFLIPNLYITLKEKIRWAEIFHAVTRFSYSLVAFGIVLGFVKVVGMYGIHGNNTPVFLPSHQILEYNLKPVFLVTKNEQQLSVMFLELLTLKSTSNVECNTAPVSPKI